MDENSRFMRIYFDASEEMNEGYKKLMNYPLVGLTDYSTNQYRFIDCRMKSRRIFFIFLNDREEYCT